MEEIIDYYRKINEILLGLELNSIDDISSLILESGPELDVKEVDNYMSLVESNRIPSPHGSLSLLIHLNSLVSKSGSLRVKINFSQKFCKYLLNCGFPQDVIRIVEELLPFVKDNEDLIVLHTHLATANRNIGAFDNAIKNYYKSRTFAISDGNQIESAWKLFLLGKMYLNYLQQPSRAAKFLLDAAEEFENEVGINYDKAIRGKAVCYDELGDVYRQAIPNYKKARSYYGKALELNSKIDYKRGVARNIAHIGTLNSLEGRHKESIQMFEQSIMLLEAIGSEQRGVGIRYIQIGYANLCLKDLTKSKENIHKGIDICKQYHTNEYLSKSYVYLGIIAQQEMNLNQALIYLSKSLEYSQKSNLDLLKSEANKIIGEIYLQINDFGKSKEHFEKSVVNNIENWINVSDNSVRLEEVENKSEYGEMYKSLFDKLFLDYKDSYYNNMNSIQIIYERLSIQQDEKNNQLNHIFHFGAIMSGLKHDILNTINNTNSVLNSLLRDPLVDNQRKDDISQVKNQLLQSAGNLSSSSFNSIIENNIAGGNFVKTDVLPLILESLDRDLAHFEVKIDFPKQFQTKILACSEMVLRLLIQTILLNSCEAFNQTIKSTRIIKISHDIRDLHFELIIEDNAGGIDDKTLGQIFKVGFTTKHNTSNSGLGLGSMRYLLNSMKGEVEVSVIKNQGTIVKLIFVIHE